MPLGEYSVEMISEEASAFGQLLSTIPPQEKVYLIDSTGQVATRAGQQTNRVRLQVVIRMMESGPQVILWSENPVLSNQGS